MPDGLHDKHNCNLVAIKLQLLSFTMVINNLPHPASPDRDIHNSPMIAIE